MISDLYTEKFNFSPLELADWSLYPVWKKKTLSTVEFLAVELRTISGSKVIR